MRQHVNPLSSFFQKPLELPDTYQLFEDENLPIHLDIGCGRGKFLLELALSQPNWNYLGIEIRSPLVKAAQEERDKLELSNLNFLYCNANVSLQNWLSRVRDGQLQRVSIQFPDPWFKRRQQKRRVFQPPLLFALSKSLNYGSELFIQSDIDLVIQPMITLIQASQCFSPLKLNSNHFLKRNPYNILTEREHYVLNKKLPVYRVLYYRNYQAIPKLSNLINNYNNLKTFDQLSPLK
tara:strand:- start:929 stop:1636 length:708 start_codon:yes stop_codon:yes gene_type:complete